MNEKFIKKSIVIVVSIIISILIIAFSASSGSFTTQYKSFAKYTFVPLQKFTAKVFDNKTYTDSKVKELTKENEDLKDEISKLELENNKLKRDKKEFDDLLETNNLKNEYNDYITIVSKIISKNNNNINNEYTINKGSNDGIIKGMNVVAKGGLVGIVEKVYKTYSIINPITSNSSNISAVVETTKDICVVKGGTVNLNTDRLTFSQMENNSNTISIGSKLFTSEISSKYYPGLFIGSITEVNIDSNNLTRSGYLDCGVNLNYLDHVLIIYKEKSNTTNTAASSDNP